MICPTTQKEEFVRVTAQVNERKRRRLFIEGCATNSQGKTLAIAYATHQILA